MRLSGLSVTKEQWRWNAECPGILRPDTDDEVVQHGSSDPLWSDAFLGEVDAQDNIICLLSACVRHQGPDG